MSKWQWMHRMAEVFRFVWIFAVVVVGIAGCTPPQPGSGDETSEIGANKENVQLAQPRQDVMQKWSRSCALCHVTGNGGAPRVGNADEWRSRIAQGEEMLLKHTVEGLNNMPPLGYCMACEREDFLAMIEFMTVTVAAEQPGDTP